ncbi:MAG: hypothetical protein ABJJ69_08980 [Paracoccaceae bacterium]
MIEQLYEDQFLETTPLFETMFDLSSSLIIKSGNFLPHGGYLNREGQISLCAAAPENDMTNSTEVLPLLHDGLRVQTSEWSTLAVAVSESVLLGENRTPAIKVLIEHRDGMTLALYKTWRKRLLRGPVFDDMFTNDAAPEVGNWKKPHFLA